MSSIGGTYGLSGSGMDIDSIVKKLMAGQQTKDDALVQKKTVLQWQKTAYNTVYDDISTFRNTVFNYKLEGTLNPNKVSSNNMSVVTATANAGAVDVNHSLVVAQLASGVNLTSTSSITPTGADKKTLATQLGVTSSFAINIGNGSASKAITITPTESINDVVSAINSAGVNVQASYDSTLDRFFLSTTNLGSTTGISISSTVTTGTPDAGADFIRKLNLFPNAAPDSTTNTGGFTTADDTTANTTTTTFSSPTGLDAEFKLDGVHLTEASNTFNISGVTYSITGVSPNVGAGNIEDKLSAGQATSVSVTNDVDKAVDNIQSLVDSYNKILAEVNGKVKETRYTDYPPLTDTQKAAMKDADITLWNTKAQSGMLHSDATLTSLVNAMRNAFSSPVSGITGTYNSASSIGITTGDYTEGGKLYLNTDKLRTALNANPNVLNQLFGAAGTTTTINGKTTTDSKSQGIAGRLYDGIKNTMDQLNQIAGTTANSQYDTNSNFAKKIIAYNTQISNATNRFNTMQSAYYKQYNAMEVALSALSSQSSWLSSQLGTSSTG
ncbi:flagellar filament capping protein FliD [Desulfosporosinus sp. Sb-LF]|uniref:flagellar filament capping protein FliD n=1 Tax=Desulfosporosinus sp. Sb-LF TaxID=2560027 RepID=UPI00107FA173|nr:flagellar filament capping protein FliD [Desulfosporosinus sp. Sb-LF]TGE32603.1 flagellar hook protein [Desulfosporosinus sp. Sb-LF]